MDGIARRTCAAVGLGLVATLCAAAPALATDGFEPGEAETVDSPAIDLLKQVRRGGDQAWAKDATLQVGQTAEYLFTVTNPGVGGPLVKLEVLDDRCDALPVYADGDADENGKLDETEAWTYRCDHVVTAADGAGFVNTAEAVAADECGDPVSDSDTATVNVTAPPSTRRRPRRRLRRRRRRRLRPRLRRRPRCRRRSRSTRSCPRRSSPAPPGCAVRAGACAVRSRPT